MQISRRSTALALSSIALGLTTAAGPATASASAAPAARVVLGSTNLVEGLASSSVAVRLAQPATLAVPGYGPASGFRAATSGRFAAFALVAKGADPDRVIISGATARDQEGRSADILMSHTSALPNGAATWQLPAGDYQLYVVPGRGRAVVRLDLRGAAGQTRTRAAVAAESQVSHPAARLLPQGQQTGGERGRLRGEGLLLAVTTSQHPLSLLQSHLDCLYVGANAFTALHAPGCPDADVRLVDVITNPNPEASLNYRAAATYSATGIDVAQGYSFTNAGLNDRVDYAALWLSF